MTENTSLDFNMLAQTCLIATDADFAAVTRQLESLNSKYNDIQIIALLNYFLLIEHRVEVLIFMLKELNKYRDSSSLQAITRLFKLKEHIPPYDEIDYTDVRIMCIKVISNLKRHESVQVLLECLNDKNENYKVRLNCADALGRIGDRYAVTPLINIVSDESEKSLYIRESAATALGLIGDIRAADSLIGILETKNGIMDKFTYLKERVIEALNKLTPDNARAFKALKNSLADENPHVRINAIEAIMNYEHEESFDLIEKMLHDDDNEVVKNAVIALFNLKGEEILEEIIQNKQYSQKCRDEALVILENEQE
jgi:HEAT repeat protein